MDASNHPLMITSTHSTALDDTLHSPPTTFSSFSAAPHSTSSTTWPTEGCVEFRNITLQYNSNSNPVLRSAQPSLRPCVVCLQICIECVKLTFQWCKI